MKWREFLEDADGVGSSTRLVFVGGFFVSSAIVLAMSYYDTMSEGILGVYLSYCLGGYGVSKWRDSKENIALAEADKPPSTIVTKSTEVAATSVDINLTGKRRKK